MGRQQKSLNLPILAYHSFQVQRAARRSTRLFVRSHRLLPALASLYQQQSLYSPQAPLISSFKRLEFPESSPYDTQCNRSSSFPTLRMASNYRLPTTNLKAVMEDDSKTPLVLLSCGSFSPITYLHLRIFEMCRDWVRDRSDYEIVGGYLSPVSDAYGKKGLVGVEHRTKMCQLATANSKWLMVDDWEAIKPEYTRTALVLDHLEHEINIVNGGIKTRNGQSKPARIALLSGADLLLSMSSPGVWSNEDLDHILGCYITYVIERTGTDLETAMAPLVKWRKNIFPIPQNIPNEVSSTKVRAFLNQNLSVRYLIPDSVLQYIEEHGLFKVPAP